MSSTPQVVVPSGFRRGAQLLARPSALSLPVTYYFLVIGLAGPLLVDTRRLGGGWLVWLGIGLLGQATVMLCFVAGERVQRRVPVRSRAIVTLVVIVISVTARGIVIGGAAMILGLAPGLEFVYRVIPAFGFVGGGLVVASLLVAARDEHLSLVRELDARRNELELLDASMDGRLAELRERLLRQVRATLEPGLRQLRDALDRAAAGAVTSDALAKLRDFVDKDVRELSRNLLATTVLPTEPADARSPRPRARVRWPSAVPMAGAIWPLAQGGVIGLAGIGSATRDLPPLPALLWVVSLAALTTVGMWLARLACRRWAPRPAVAVVVAGAIGGCVTLGALTALAAGFPASPRLVAAPGLVVGAALAAAIATYSAVAANRAAIESELDAGIAALHESIARLRQHTWVTRRRLSLVVHGSIQSVIHAAILRLGTVDATDAAALQAIRADVEAALRRLDTIPADATALRQTLLELAETWDGVCDVTWVVSDAAAEILDTHADCCECSAEIVREGVHNSAVHGRATRVDILIDCVADRIAVQVIDDGESAEGPPGLGSQMLDDMCLEWTRTATGSGTTLSAILTWA